MDPRNLYVLFFRRGVKGATSGFIVASSLAAAEKLGQSYCSNELNCRYIRTESAIIATEDALKEDDLEALTAPKTPPPAPPRAKVA